MSAELDRAALQHVLELLRPLRGLADEEGLADLLDALGWDGEALGLTDPTIFELDALENAFDALNELVGQEHIELPDLAKTLAAAGLAVAQVVQVISRLPGLSTDALGDLSEDVLAFLVEHHVASRYPRLALVLALLGIFKPVDTARFPLDNGAVLRRPTRHRAIDLSALGRALRDPFAYAREQFLIDPQGARRTAAPIADLIGPELADGLISAGLAASYGIAPPEPGLILTPEESDAVKQLLLVDTSLPTGGAPGVRSGLRLVAGLTDDTPPSEGLGVLLAASADLALSSVPVASGTLSAHLKGPTLALLLTGQSVRPAEASTSGVTLDADLEYRTTPGAAPAARFGPAAGTRLEVAEVRVGVQVTLDSAGVDVGGTVDLHGLLLAIRGGDGDGFLSSVLPKDPIEVRADLGLDVSTRKGLHARGGGALDARFLIGKSIGPLRIPEAHLALRPTGESLALHFTATLGLTLGPIRATVDSLGLAATLRSAAAAPATTSAAPAAPATGNLGSFDLAMGFRPPSGVGLAINAAAVTGGGYLSFDPDKGEYAGAAELSIGMLSLKAIGLLTTRLPDGRPGFSLLLLVTADFPPIQLGFGFTLLGVGGLLGVQRTVALDALRAGVRTRALDAVLFPKSPVANAPQLLGALRTLFPPAEGRFTFGPMVRLGWGPNQLLELQVALILELPSPLRLVVLGRIQAVLPDKRAAIVQLRLDVLGILDFDRGEVSVDASLIDSRLAAFTLSGDMALRAGWKATTGFALAVGGFHPRFTPPPGFPTLQRLAISLAAGDNPRIRLEAYLAITSNSVQFGARLDLYVAAGPFSATAYAALDALVQFAPFHFLVSLSMGIDIAWGGTPLLHAQLEANLEGPTPWHIYGYVEFGILFLKARLGVDLTVGGAAAEEPARIDLPTVLRHAFEADDAWAAALPPAARAGATLRALAAADGLVVHPLGRFTVRQRALPLATTISRYGAAVPAPDTATRFALAGITVGDTQLVHPPGVSDEFAAAQYADISDDERLSRPAFEAMPSGAVATVDAYRWPVDDHSRALATTATISYDQAVIVDPAAPTPPPTTNLLLHNGLAGLLVAGGAAARSQARERAAVRGPDRRVQVVGERYLPAALDTLPPAQAAAAATSYTQAAEQRGDGQLVTAGEVTG